MNDNRLTLLRVIRSEYTSGSTHGDETVQTGFKGTGSASAQRATLAKMIVAGAVANGFPTELWTLPRVAMLINGSK